MWGVGCARLRRAGEGAGARESGEQRSGEARQRGEGSRERQHRRWYCIALWESRLPPLSETPRIYTPRALFADTTLVHVTKPHFGSKYSGVLRSPQELKIIGDPAQMKFVLCRYAPRLPTHHFFCLSINLSVKKCRNAMTTARRERSEAIDRAERQRTPY